MVPVIALAILLGLAGCSGGSAAGKTAPSSGVDGSAAPHHPAREHGAPISRRPGQPVNRMPPPTGMYWATTATGYLSAQRTLYRTTDGGTSWTALYHSAQAITTVAGSGAASLWIVAGRSLLDIGEAGGVVRSVSLPEGGSVAQLVSASTEIAYLRMGGQIYAWDAVTGSWTNVSGTLGSVTAMVWLSSSEGYAAVGRTLWRTSSGGQSWTLVFSAPIVGSGWTSQLAANSMNSVWFLGSGGAVGMSQVGFVLWHGTDQGTQWAAIADDAYMAPTGYPAVRPIISSTIMQPGPLAAVGASTVYFAGWHANRSSQWVVLTNAGGTWHASSIPITATTPQFDMPHVELSLLSETTGFILGQSASGNGTLLETTNGGTEWRPAELVTGN